MISLRNQVREREKINNELFTVYFNCNLTTFTSLSCPFLDNEVTHWLIHPSLACVLTSANTSKKFIIVLVPCVKDQLKACPSGIS